MDEVVEAEQRSGLHVHGYSEKEGGVVTCIAGWEPRRNPARWLSSRHPSQHRRTIELRRLSPY